MEFDNNIPIYIQLVQQLKIDIISGKIKSGERLPSVRDLALQTKVNPNTMQKALTELEDLKLIYTERTNGKFVTEDKALILKYKEEYADELSKKYFANMQNIGFDKEEAIKYLSQSGGKK
ncbi:MAG: GntR family transcriptional regulator [Ruminococcaceae bacterium]|nr:GntR family transcriptional regulator [Oscillospiraceae bacterium]